MSESTEEIGVPALSTATTSLEELYLSDESRNDPLFKMQISRNKKVQVSQLMGSPVANP
jgi:hypothetical protein